MAEEVKATWDDNILAHTQCSINAALETANDRAVEKIEAAANKGKNHVTLEVPSHLSQQFVDQWNEKHAKVEAHLYALDEHITFKW